MDKYLIVRTDTRIVNGCARHTDRVLKRLYRDIPAPDGTGADMRALDDIVMTARGYCRNERSSFYITVYDPKGSNIWGCDVQGTHD